jgi:cytoplasmic iron level regulating protein YaaA (DUF328/UPF0246 family)
VLVVLPPSETKRDGGADAVLELSALGFADLTPQRVAALAALRRLSRNRRAAVDALHLGPTQNFEIDRNRTIASAPVLPAVERYTGVLFDALDVGSLPVHARAIATRTVVIHSALFGLLRADDPIPAYRLSHDSRLPGLSLRTLWSGPVAEALRQRRPFVLDARSESYRHLGRAPEGSWYLRMVSADPAGKRTPLNHANKKSKGQFTRALMIAGIEHETVDSLIDWAAASGFSLSKGAQGELDLVV